MSPLPDRHARTRALDITGSFIVKAPAGSGKTSLLVARFLALLAQARDPEEVVAITFTRKATAEMRDRVLDTLTGAGNAPPAAGHERHLHELARAVMARDREQGWDLARDPRRLRIQTIDSLCAGLCRQLPVVSGLGGRLGTEEQPDALYREAARRTLGLLGDPRLGRPVAQVLDHLDGNMAAFEDLLAQMLARRDQWARYLHLEDPARRRAELEAGLEALVSAALAAAHEALPADRHEPLVALASFAAERAATAGIDVELEVLRGIDQMPGTGGSDLAPWKAIAGLLLTARNSLRRRPPGGLFVAGECREEYDAMASLLEELAGAPRLEAALAAVRGLPAPRYEDAQWLLLMELFEVLRLAVATLRLEFAARGATDFAEQVAAAAQALGEEDAPTDLALALDYRIRHLLVDEFQDTSAAHFDILRKLVAGWSPGDGHTLFLVGDPMQSIYRFREAEVGLFLECYQRGLDHLSLEPLALSANFRSRPGIVGWINGTFPGVLAERDDPVRGAAAYEACESTRDDPALPAVMLHATVEAGPEAVATALAAEVARTREATPGASIAVLLRSRAHGAALLPALEARGPSWRGVDLLPLLQVPAVRDLHALACALLHPLDRASWLAVLRAPWCGLTLDDLEALVDGDADGPLAARLDDVTARKRLSPDGRNRLERVAALLLAAGERQGRGPLSRITARPWRALGGPACLGGARLEDARRYLRLLAELEEDSPVPDPDELARRASALYAAPRPGAVDVEVMTIHKAKGLEFDVVLVPALERRASADSRAMLAWSEAATPLGPRLLLAPLPPPEGEQDAPLNAFVRGVERDKLRLELARVLYVACTRAREALHLYADVAWSERQEGPLSPSPDSLLAALWPVVRDRFKGPAEPPSPSPVAAGARAFRRLPGGWQPPAVAVPAIPQQAAVFRHATEVEFSWAGETARHVGTVAHDVLRQIAEQAAEGRDPDHLGDGEARWRERLASLGVPEDEREAAVAAVGSAVRGTLADPRGRWLLEPGHRHARSEYAVSGVLDGVLVNAVLDRTFVDADGVRWIVDYKTGSHGGGGMEEFLDREQDRYREQLERYARLLAGMESRPTRLGLYFPSIGGWREWAWPPDGG